MRRWFASSGLAILLGASACAPAVGAPPAASSSTPAGLPAAPSATANAAPWSPAALDLRPDADGFLRAWALSDPLPRPTDLPPDPDPAAAPDAWTGWRAIFGEPGVDLSAVSAESQTAVYAAVAVVAAASTPAVLHVGADDGSAVWVDGTRVPAIDDPGPHAWAPDARSAPITLHPGENVVVIRVRQAGGAWRFSVRLSDPDGEPIPGITLRLPGAAAPAHLAALGEALLAATRVEPRFTLGRSGLTATVAPTLPDILHGDSGVHASTAGAPLPLDAPSPLPLTPDGRGVLVATVTLRGPGDAQATRTFERSPPTAQAMLVADATDTLAELRRTSPALFTPRPAPQLGSWAETLHPPSPPVTGLDSTAVATLEWLTEALRGAIEDGVPDPAWIVRLSDQLTPVLASVRHGEDPFAGRTGPMWMAYRSRLDSTAQPFALVVPKTYSPRRTWTLHVGLHGLGSGPGRFIREMLGVPLNRGESDVHAERAFPLGVSLPDPTDFVVAPYGRGDLAFRGPGEDDVLSVIDTVLSRYPIDHDRVDLTGVSMGGIGVFEIATRHPDIFSHAQPLAGAADIRRFSSLRGKAITEPEAAVLASVTAIELAENLGNLPLDAVHGRKDTAMADDHTARMMERLAALGSPDKTFTRPDLGHNVQDTTYAGGSLWTKALRSRTRSPDHVTFRTADLHVRGAYWVRIDAAAASGRFSLIDAVREGDRVRVTTENVAAFSLLTAAAPGPVTIDGVEGIGPPAKGASAGPVRSFARRGASFAPIARADPADPPGPLGINRSAPRLFTYATGDPAMEAASRALAERLANPSGIRGSTLPVVPDTAVGEAELDAWDIVAVGTPATHAVLRAAAATSAGLPVRFDGDVLWFKDQQYPGADVGAAFAVANPLRPRHALLVWTGSPAALTLARCLPRYLPDFVVFDHHIRCVEAGNVLDGRSVLALGLW